MPARSAAPAAHSGQNGPAAAPLADAASVPCLMMGSQQIGPAFVAVCRYRFPGFSASAHCGRFIHSDVISGAVAGCGWPEIACALSAVLSGLLSGWATKVRAALAAVWSDSPGRWLPRRNDCCVPTTLREHLTVASGRPCARRDLATPLHEFLSRRPAEAARGTGMKDPACFQGFSAFAAAGGKGS